jgi:hypothetical protein
LYGLEICKRWQPDFEATEDEDKVGREKMQLRHIRPGSVDWNDAINKGLEEELVRMSPEEVKKLHAVSATKRLVKGPVSTLKDPEPQNN